jgi:hypothetical protein
MVGRTWCPAMTQTASRDQRRLRDAINGGKAKAPGQLPDTEAFIRGPSDMPPKRHRSAKGSRCSIVNRKPAPDPSVRCSVLTEQMCLLGAVDIEALVVDAFAQLGIEAQLLDGATRGAADLGLDLDGSLATLGRSPLRAGKHAATAALRARPARASRIARSRRRSARTPLGQR